MNVFLLLREVFLIWCLPLDNANSDSITLQVKSLESKESRKINVALKLRHFKLLQLEQYGCKCPQGLCLLEYNTVISLLLKFSFLISNVVQDHCYFHEYYAYFKNQCTYFFQRVIFAPEMSNYQNLIPSQIEFYYIQSFRTFFLFLLKSTVCS